MFWRSAGQAKWGGKSRMSKKVTQQGKGKRVSAKESWSHLSMVRARIYELQQVNLDVLYDQDSG